VTYGGITPKFPPLGDLYGDYNDNHVVDGADYVVWRKFLSQNVSIPNDETDGMVTQEDYNLWEANFNLTTLVPTSSLPADVNNSGSTDVNDYIIIRNNFLGTNKSLATGDVSGDTVVNFTDFRLWKMRRTAGAGAGIEPFGSGLGISGNASVPEPSSSLIIATVALLCAAWRRRSLHRFRAEHAPAFATQTARRGRMAGMKVSRTRAILGGVLVVAGIVLFFSSAYFATTTAVYVAVGLMAIGTWIAGREVNVGD
jgi:hypothetical protein